MARDPDDLDIAELAGQAGVSVKTIRYYQQHGLLSAPGVRGPGARLDAERHARRFTANMLKWDLALNYYALEGKDMQGRKRRTGRPTT